MQFETAPIVWIHTLFTLIPCFIFSRQYICWWSRHWTEFFFTSLFLPFWINHSLINVCKTRMWRATKMVSYSRACNRCWWKIVDKKWNEKKMYLLKNSLCFLLLFNPSATKSRMKWATFELWCVDSYRIFRFYDVARLHFVWKRNTLFNSVWQRKNNWILLLEASDALERHLLANPPFALCTFSRRKLKFSLIFFSHCCTCSPRLDSKPLFVENQIVQAFIQEILPSCLRTMYANLASTDHCIISLGWLKPSSVSSTTGNRVTVLCHGDWMCRTTVCLTTSPTTSPAGR